MSIKQINSNCTELTVGEVKILFSYRTPVAVETPIEVMVTDQHYSKTTSKHITQWLDGRKATKVSQATINGFINP